MIRVKIAGHVFGLENRYPEVEKTCRKYLCHEQPEAVFSVTQQKTDSLHLGRADGENESTALHACIVQHLIPQDYLLFHGSCLALDGQAILFTAPSGTGKSTHSRLWRERFGSRVQMVNSASKREQRQAGLTMPSESRIEHDLVMVNDDKPLLQLTPHGWLAHGTPWSGKHSLGSRPGDPDFDTPAAFPLRAIVVIKRGETNTIRRLTPAEAADHFFHQTYFPSTLVNDRDGENASESGAQASGAAATVPGDSVAGSKADAFALRLKALNLMGRLTHLPIYELHCTISQEAVELTLQALRDNSPE